MSHRRRDDFDEQSLRLAQLLRSWDLLGVYQGDVVPSDDEEYDDLVVPILGWLAGGAGPEELSRRLGGRLASHYGLRSNSDLADLDFARHIHAWWLLDGR